MLGNLSIIVVSCYVIFLSSHVASLDDDLSITFDQKEILDNFRNVVSSRLPHDYMSADIYLIRWLRARKFDISAAEKMLMENLKWREENDIDNILNEDWSDFESVFHIEIQGCDKEGSPVISIPGGDWDVRGAILVGTIKRAKRYYDKLMEEPSFFIRNAQKHGENMTQFSIIFDLSNFSLMMHGCTNCAQVYVHFFHSMESHYPGNIKSVTVINAPQIFLTFYQVLRGFLSPESRAMISIYGKDKNEWKQALLKKINASELTKEYGGLNEEGFSIEEFKKEMMQEYRTGYCLRTQAYREEKAKLHRY